MLSAGVRFLLKTFVTVWTEIGSLALHSHYDDDDDQMIITDQGTDEELKMIRLSSKENLLPTKC